METAKNKHNLTEHMSYWLISWHISVMHSSMVFGMILWAVCKVYGTVKIYANVYISNIYIWCKQHTQYIIVYVQVWYTEVDLCKRYKHRAWNKISYEKNVLNMRLIYVKNHKSIKGKIENTYILYGRATFLEIARITNELNCIHKHKNTLHETSVTKINLFGITVIYIFVQVNMTITSYFYMKLTGRFRWMTDTCHLCSLQHWKLYHVWKNMTIVMMTVKIL